jgi:tRNA A37 threonylcarbamoyladenosine dehydratase
MERFLRIDRLIGREKRESLGTKRVCIVGMGAVGGYALEALARSGVGAFTLVDFDRINKTNINRQILALESTLGRSKTEAARERVQDINPACDVRIFDGFAHDESLDEIFRDEPDLLVDAIDSMAPKLSLLEYAWKNGFPVVSSMGAALHQDPFSLRCDDLMKTHSCPLARQLRKKLRRRDVGRGIRCVYSTETVDYDYRDPDDEDDPSSNEQILDRGRKRKVLGSLPTVTGLFGLQIGHEALRILLKE